ncbi:hypothetical protein GMST_14990 [Geomonas silvestris]|uniref:FdhE C-terminal domain-containing protein n=1 Tax=Geomonas silvestris TaxID=2740184 RepID=A0A6V8MGZ4_9BACT|nr:formate dehydrogenase accessory protein FdhE [Geomonas silvestris]GFO59174.1 hypothetical protein GMST_14990 [Geomonas silvestris]
MRTTASENLDPVVKRLREIAAKVPELRVTTRLYETILPVQRQAEVRAAALALEPGDLHRALSGGEPLLAAADVEVDVDAAAELMLQMLVALGEAELPDAGARWRLFGGSAESWSEDEVANLATLRRSARGIHRLLRNGRLDPGELLAQAASGDRTGFGARFAAYDVDWELLWTLAQHALKPFLHEVRRQAPLEEIGVWQQGECYVCGASATLGELQDNDQVKHLRCGQCGADWYHPRLKCHHCGNEDHATLRYLHAEGDEHRRVEACDRCQSYLKVITSFTPTDPELVVVEDLATLDLDFLAQQHGYQRP